MNNFALKVLVFLEKANNQLINQAIHAQNYPVYLNAIWDCFFEVFEEWAALEALFRRTGFRNAAEQTKLADYEIRRANLEVLWKSI